MVQVLEGEPLATSPPVRVIRVPGSEEAYSNGGYVLVAQLLQDSVAEPFPVLMDDAVLAPTGMASSTFVQEVPEACRATTAVPHGWDIEAWAERTRVGGAVARQRLGSRWPVDNRAGPGTVRGRGNAGLRREVRCRAVGGDGQDDG